jgi:uncharacterized membrane protein
LRQNRTSTERGANGPRRAAPAGTGPFANDACRIRQLPAPHSLSTGHRRSLRLIPLHQYRERGEHHRASGAKAGAKTETPDLDGRGEGKEPAMSNSTQVLAAVYPTHEQAKTILDTLQHMHRAKRIDLADAAIVMKGEDGKVNIEETAELTTKEGAVRGALIAGVVGLIFPPSLIGSLLVGGGLGGLVGRIRDTGIKNKQLKGIADSLEPGKSAVIALAAGASVPQIQVALQGYEGTLLTHALSEEEMKELYLEAERAKTASN